MAKFFGAQRLVLQVILDAQGDSQGFIDDTLVAQKTQISLRDTRDYLLTLDQNEYIDLALAESGLKAAVNARGRLALGLYQPFPTTTAPSPPSPSRSRVKTGHERALVIGVSTYPPPVRTLPAVANDVREIAGLLRSDGGQFPDRNVTELVEASATRDNVLKTIDSAFNSVAADDSVFVYMAGHGAVENGDYYFVAHDSNPDQLAASGVPLTLVKNAFESSRSQRAFLWLDFCHSGGILARSLKVVEDDTEVIDRQLKRVAGEGKLIMAACTPAELAYEAGHGLFTGALLRGLKGEAAKDREVTVNSLFDYIDRQIGGDRQRPMMYGQMTGRIVLMQFV